MLVASLNSSWIPDEDAQTLFSERCWLQGVVVSAVAYGIIFFLYIMTFYLLVCPENRVVFGKRLPLLIYITLAFILGTLFMVSLAIFTQMAFVDYRNYPGGPSAFENNMFSIPVDDAGNAAFVLSNWLCDALVVWRFKVIYQSSRISLWILMFFPCLVFSASVAMGIMFLIQVSTTNPYVTNGINFTLPYLSISLALNILLTIAIVLRLFTFRWYYRHVDAKGMRFEAQYTSLAAITVESAALYSIVSIAFLILFGISNAASQVFLQSLSQIQTVATLLIVFRLAQGKGWTTGTATRLGTRTEGMGSCEMQSASHASLTGVRSRGDQSDASEHK